MKVTSWSARKTHLPLPQPHKFDLAKTKSNEERLRKLRATRWLKCFLRVVYHKVHRQRRPQTQEHVHWLAGCKGCVFFCRRAFPREEKPFPRQALLPRSSELHGGTMVSRLAAHQTTKRLRRGLSLALRGLFRLAGRAHDHGRPKATPRRTWCARPHHASLARMKPPAWSRMRVTSCCMEWHPAEFLPSMTSAPTRLRPVWSEWNSTLEKFWMRAVQWLVDKLHVLEEHVTCERNAGNQK